MQSHIKKPKKNYLKKTYVNRRTLLETLKSFEDITNKIGSLHAQGFDRIHLPGGTSKDGKSFSGGTVDRFNPLTKNVEFLGLPYNSNFHLKGESGHNKKSGESPEESFIREVMEETGLHITLNDLEPLFEKKIPDNRPGREGEYHTKYFYLVRNFSGNLFTFDGPNPIDGETAAPLWIPAQLFVKVVFGGHLKAVKLAIEKLSMENREYAIALMNIL